MRVLSQKLKYAAVFSVTALVLSGCATMDIDEALGKSATSLQGFTEAELILKRSNTDNEHANAIVDSLLDAPLTQAGAIQVALANSPSFQAKLANNWASAAQAAQSGRIANPMLALERMEIGSETELTALLSFGLLDVFTLPARQRRARSELGRAQITLTADVVSQITDVRQTWVKAITAEQRLEYARQVFDSAEASAELAKRMQAVGNFSRLDRARQHSFYTDAATALTTRTHDVLAAREALIRSLGLSAEQTEQLQLPTRLPELPEQPRSTEEVGRVATADRLDIQLAEASLKSAAQAQGFNSIFSYTDIELGLLRQRIEEDGERTRGDGYEIEISLPVFDWGGMKRAAMNANTLAAANILEATLRDAASTLRESYSAYRTAFDVARFYQTEILPLQEMIAEENVLRYNGMLIGVFELLADARRQIGIVQSAIDANEQFWMSDAALQATLVGNPTMASVGTVGAIADANPGH
ncbi:MAG: outer membrane protein TolC [Granulosicoccus sp.]|jgi:outer membrane protein TolC